MVISYDAKRALCNGSGLGTFSRTLLRDLAASGQVEPLLFSPRQGPYPTDLPLRLAPRRTALGQSLWRAHGMVRQLSAEGVVLYHGLSGELPRGLRASGIRSVVTIHDLIFFTHPECYNPIDVATYKLRLRRTLGEADRVVAISECTRRDLVRFCGLAPERIEVVYQSIAPRYQHPAPEEERLRVRQLHALPERYILSVGTIEARKNTLLALKALEGLPQEVHLVLAGRRTPYADRLERYALKHGLAHRLHLLHGLPDQDLPALYQQAEVFVYPSLYEGFGIPIVEAISAGLPVVACTGSCLEESGGPDSVYVDPTSAEELREALLALLADPQRRASVAQSSRKYIHRFNNSGSAQQYIQIYHDLTASP